MWKESNYQAYQRTAGMMMEQLVFQDLVFCCNAQRPLEQTLQKRFKLPANCRWHLQISGVGFQVVLTEPLGTPHPANATCWWPRGMVGPEGDHRNSVFKPDLLQNPIEFKVLTLEQSNISELQHGTSGHVPLEFQSVLNKWQTPYVKRLTHTYQESKHDQNIKFVQWFGGSSMGQKTKCSLWSNRVSSLFHENVARVQKAFRIGQLYHVGV